MKASKIKMTSICVLSSTSGICSASVSQVSHEPECYLHYVHFLELRVQLSLIWTVGEAEYTKANLLLRWDRLGYEMCILLVKLIPQALIGDTYQRTMARLVGLLARLFALIGAKIDVDLA